MTRTFLDLLAGEARRAEALYILGDLFEAWIGDDALSDTAREVADGLARLGDETPVFFMSGNRDFLLGDAYARRCRMTRLADPTTVDLHGVPTLLTHGDTLCTDDVAYQRFRRRMRQPWLQRLLLALPARIRLALARHARDASRRHTGSAPAAIMDVNEGAVADAFAAAGVSRMIHGHTHRPAIHDYPDGRRRIVLGDWYEHGSVLRVDTDGVRLESIPLTA